MIDAAQWRERLGEERRRTLPELIAMLVVAAENDDARLHTLQRESAIDTLREATSGDLLDEFRELLPLLFPDQADEIQQILGRPIDR